MMCLCVCVCVCLIEEFCDDNLAMGGADGSADAVRDGWRADARPGAVRLSAPRRSVHV